MRISITLFCLLNCMGCLADDIYDMAITNTQSELDELEKGKKIGAQVSVPCNKQLVSYASLGVIPHINEYVVVPVVTISDSDQKHTKWVWGKVIARNHYIFVVQASKYGGSYYTEYNMYKMVKKSCEILHIE